jgi:hypothetical protein
MSDRRNDENDKFIPNIGKIVAFTAVSIGNEADALKHISMNSGIRINIINMLFFNMRRKIDIPLAKNRFY